MRITQDVCDQVLRLLAQTELSHRKVASLVGISRATVAKIATGKYRPYQPSARESDSYRPTGPRGRCPICGGMVYLPCRLCKVRAVKERERARQTLNPRPRPKLRAPSEIWYTEG